MNGYWCDIRQAGITGREVENRETILLRRSSKEERNSVSLSINRENTEMNGKI